MGAEEPAHGQLDHHTLAADRRIGQTPLVRAVRPHRILAATGHAAASAPARAQMHNRPPAGSAACPTRPSHPISLDTHLSRIEETVHR